jgi:hypothetical protein
MRSEYIFELCKCSDGEILLDVHGVDDAHEFHNVLRLPAELSENVGGRVDVLLVLRVQREE